MLRVKFEGHWGVDSTQFVCRYHTVYYILTTTFERSSAIFISSHLVNAKSVLFKIIADPKWQAKDERFWGQVPRIAVDGCSSAVLLVSYLHEFEAMLRECSRRLRAVYSSTWHLTYAPLQRCLIPRSMAVPTLKLVGVAIWYLACTAHRTGMPNCMR